MLTGSSKVMHSRIKEFIKQQYNLYLIQQKHIKLLFTEHTLLHSILLLLVYTRCCIDLPHQDRCCNICTAKCHDIGKNIHIYIVTYIYTVMCHGIRNVILPKCCVYCDIVHLLESQPRDWSVRFLSHVAKVKLILSH